MALSSLSFKKLWLELFDTITSNWENFINSCIPLRNLKIKYNFQHLNSMTFFVPFQFLQFDGGVYHLFNRGNELSLKRNQKLNRKNWIWSMNKFKTFPKITFNESQYAKKFPSNLDENENRARKKGRWSQFKQGNGE